MPSRRLLTRSVALLLALAVFAAGCGDSGADAKNDDQGAAAAPASTIDIPKDELVSMVGQSTVTITVVDNTFEPQYVEVSAGTKVIWKNEGRNEHNIIPTVDGAFPGIEHHEFVPGSSHIVTFSDPGDFPYFCSIHGTKKNGQNGAIRVVAK